MTEREHTSERTSLGLVLQHLVEYALTQQGITFKPNVGYYNGFIKPDVLIPDIPPKFSVHVTATGPDDSFRMKKWRYIDEVLQMRSVWGNQFVAINVLFGPVVAYRAIDRRLLKQLFDSEIIVHDFDTGDTTFRKALTAIAAAAPNDKSRTIATALLADSGIMETVQQLGKSLKEITDTSPKSAAAKSACDSLGSFLKTRETYLKQHPPVARENVAWKRSILRFLAVTLDYWPILHSLVGKEADPSKLDPRLVKEALRAKLVNIRDGACGTRTLSLTSELGMTIRAGLTLDLLESVKKAVEADPRRKYELEDLWDNGTRATTAVAEVGHAFAKGRNEVVALVARSIQFGGSLDIAHHRAHVIDVLLAATGLSQSQLQVRCPSLKIGVQNPLQNIIPRTELALQALKVGKLDPVTAAESIVTEFDAIDWSNEDGIKEKYISLRVFNLTKGSSINPLEEFVSAELIQMGWAIKSPTVVSRNSLVGKVRTDFSAVASKNERLIVLKCLFGDTGADHKAEEMEARMRMLRLNPPTAKELITVFVADGKWANNNLRCLVLGGWDHVVGVAEFPKLLRFLS